MSGSKPMGRGLRGLQGDYSKESADITEVHCVSGLAFGCWFYTNTHTYVYIYICVCVYTRKSGINQSSTTLNPIRHSRTTPPPELSPSNILPPPSTHCARIPAGKYLARV